VENENVIVKKYKAGDYVVCNLSSVNLGKVVQADVLERLINIQVRMLDNVIDINTLPLKQTTITNHKYRADRKSTRLNYSHVSIYTISLHDALPICRK